MVLALCVSGSQGAVPSRWRLQPRLRPRNGAFNAVSCPSERFCMAVGDVQAGFGEPSTLAERWNGLSWAILRTPKPPGSVGGSLEGVSCTSATACTAVGVKVTKRGGRPAADQPRWPSGGMARHGRSKRRHISPKETLPWLLFHALRRAPAQRAEKPAISTGLRSWRAGMDRRGRSSRRRVSRTRLTHRSMPSHAFRRRRARP